MLSNPNALARGCLIWERPKGLLEVTLCVRIINLVSETGLSISDA